MNYYEFLHRWDKRKYNDTYRFNCDCPCHFDYSPCPFKTCLFNMKNMCILSEVKLKHGYYKSWNQIMYLAQGLLKLGVLTK